MEIPHKFMHSILHYVHNVYMRPAYFYTVVTRCQRRLQTRLQLPARPSRPKSINVCLIMNNLHLKCFLWFKLRNFDYKWYCVLATRLARCPLSGWGPILGPINDLYLCNSWLLAAGSWWSSKGQTSEVNMILKISLWRTEVNPHGHRGTKLQNIVNVKKNL